MIHDHEWCADLGDQGASCVHTISTEKRNIDKELWDVERMGMLCTSSGSFSDMKTSLLKLCNLSKKCKYEAQEKITEFFDRMDEASK